MLSIHGPRCGVVTAKAAHSKDISWKRQTTDTGRSNSAVIGQELSVDSDYTFCYHVIISS